MIRPGETGQTSVLTLGLAFVAMAVAGVGVDGTRAFLLRRSLQNVADAAALSAASELDAVAYHRRGGKDVVLDRDAAEAAAARTLRDRRLPHSAAIEAGPEEVVVALRASAPTLFLGLVGIRRIPVAVEARAAPVAGEVPGG